MHAEALIKLIEEMIEIKIRQHAGTTAGASASLTPDLARVLAMAKVADRERILHIRSELVEMLEGGTDEHAS